MDRLDRHEFKHSDPQLIYVTWRGNGVWEEGVNGRRQVAVMPIGDEILRLAEREKELTEERDGYLLASGEGQEIIGELSDALAVHLGEKANAAVKASLEAWDALQQGNEKAAKIIEDQRARIEVLETASAGTTFDRETLEKRIAELEATNDDYFIEKQALGRDKDLLKARIAELETALCDCCTAKQAIGTENHLLKISAAETEGERLADVLFAMDLDIGREGEERRLRLENGRLHSQLLAAETEKVRLRQQVKETEGACDLLRATLNHSCLEGLKQAKRIGEQDTVIAEQAADIEQLKDQKARLQVAVQDLLAGKFPEVAERLQEQAEQIEQLKVDVAHWRKMAVRDDPPMNDDPQAVAAAHQRLVDEGYIKARAGDLPWFTEPWKPGGTPTEIKDRLLTLADERVEFRRRALESILADPDRFRDPFIRGARFEEVIPPEPHRFGYDGSGKCTRCGLPENQHQNRTPA